MQSEIEELREKEIELRKEKEILESRERESRGSGSAGFERDEEHLENEKENMELIRKAKIKIGMLSENLSREIFLGWVWKNLKWVRGFPHL